MLCFSHVLVPRTSILSRPRKRALAVEIYSTSRKYGSVGPSATDSQEIYTGAPIVMRSRGEPIKHIAGAGSTALDMQLTARNTLPVHLRVAIQDDLWELFWHRVSVLSENDSCCR